MNRLIDLNKIKKNALLSWCFLHAKKLKIELQIHPKTPDGICYACTDKRIIVLNPKTFNKKKLAFAFFHEIGHFEIINKGLFKDMNDKPSIRVERWCDNYGEKEALKYFKNPICYKPYHTERGKEYIKNLRKEIKEYNKLKDTQ